MANKRAQEKLFNRYLELGGKVNWKNYCGYARNKTETEAVSEVGESRQTKRAIERD